MRRTFRERFEHFILPADPLTGCILWGGPSHNRGYGSLSIGSNSSISSHRAAWQLYIGPIPKGLNVLHRCNAPPCVNVFHLYVGTQSENLFDCVRDGRNPRARKTHCPQGHPYDRENTYLEFAGKARRRHCRICNQAAVRRYWEKKVAAR